MSSIEWVGATGSAPDTFIASSATIAAAVFFEAIILFSKSISELDSKAAVSASDQAGGITFGRITNPEDRFPDVDESVGSL